MNWGLNVFQKSGKPEKTAHNSLGLPQRTNDWRWCRIGQDLYLLSPRQRKSLRKRGLKVEELTATNFIRRNHETSQSQ